MHAHCLRQRATCLRSALEEIGSQPPPQGHGWQSPERGPALRQAEKGRHRKAANPVHAKARPPRTGGRAPVLRLHPNGKPHESANCSPGRQGHQSNSDYRCFGFTVTHGSRAPGLARSGWVIARLLIRPPSCKAIKTALPNHSLNRTHCGAPPFSPPFHSGSNAVTPQCAG